MRKTAKVRELEAARGQRIEVIVAEAYNRAGTVRGAAEALDVKVDTFYGWMVRLGIRIKRIKSVAVAPPAWWNGDEEVGPDELGERVAT